MSEGETYTIRLDGRWTLEDLYRFPRAYEQVYFFVHSLVSEVGEFEAEAVDHIYRTYPWMGGYSAVGFFNSLKYRTPPKRRPRIASLHYASPGWIELVLLVGVAFQISLIVRHVASSINTTNETYNNVVKGLRERELLQIRVERERLRLDQEKMDFILSSTTSLAKIVGVENISQLQARTGNPLIALKILLAVYRRIRLLADYTNKGKAEFNNSKLTDKDDIDSLI